MSTFDFAGFPARGIFATALLSSAIGLMSPAVVSAQDIGLIVDDAGVAHVFDMSTDSVSDFAAVPTGLSGDCSMAGDQATAWLTNFSGNVFEVDLAADPPALGAAIPISNSGIDTALTPDGKFLLVAGGGVAGPLSVFDLAASTEVLPAVGLSGSTHTSVDVCSDGVTVLATSGSGSVFSGSIDELGVITGGGSLANAGAWNVYCAPSAQTGVAIGVFAPNLTSFTIPSLTLADKVNTVGFGAQSAVFNSDGTKIFVATLSTVEAYHFDQTNGDIDFIWSINLARQNTWYGMDQIMLNPAEDKLYVGGAGGGVKILNPLTGADLGSISGPSAPTGLCKAAPTADIDTDSDGVLDSADLCPDTVEDVPSKKFGNNRWAWDGADWVTESRDDPDPDEVFTMEETQGCSCNQILDVLADKTGLPFEGHYKMGCSSGLVEEWIEGYYHLETVVVPADDGNGAVSNTVLSSGENYQLVAHGAADAVELDLQVNGSSVDWGSPNPDHLYMHDLPGADAPVLLQVGVIGDPGEITVEIFVELW